MNQRNKVLFVCSKESFFYKPIKKALESLGFEVVLGDYLDHPIISRKTLLHKIVRRMPGVIKSFLINFGQRQIDAKILNQAIKEKPYLILVNKDKYMFTETIGKLRAIAPTVNWYTETMNNWGTIKKIVDHYDHFFNYDKYIVDLLKKEGHKNVYYLPFGADLDKDARWPDLTDYKYDVIFLGSFVKELYPERETFLDAIKDLGLHVWGNKAWLDTSLKDYYFGPLTPDAKIINDLYQSAKIVVHSDLITKIVAGSGITLRPYDVTASGAMLLAHNDRKELFEIFKESEEFVSFKDGKDLREKVKYYLEHEEERRKIAKAGFDGTRLHRTYMNRIQEILDVVNSKPRKQKITE